MRLHVTDHSTEKKYCTPARAQRTALRLIPLNHQVCNGRLGKCQIPAHEQLDIA